jgi:hypothetical protein
VIAGQNAIESIGSGFARVGVRGAAGCGRKQCDDGCNTDEEPRARRGSCFDSRAS